ncbi:XF1762 family protein [Pluralibacter gergoviae]|uniref:XF1762 family protein n=1 Tax=Pluralibacter gergoviae TaxID=61647 RepID=UPI003EE03104
MKIVPITFRAACKFVAENHRHNRPPVGHKFSVGLMNQSGELIGVAMAGRPIARHFDDGLTIEVNRTCTTGERNANSALYGAVWRAARAMGYQRCITYTQANESGASLRAAGFVRVKALPARSSWAEASIQRRNGRRQDGGWVPRQLWEIVRNGVSI